MSHIPLDEFRALADESAVDTADTLPHGMTVDRDIVYCSPPERELRLDIYRPDAPSGPAMVFVHGGGWKGGDKAQFSRQAAWLAAARGITSACIEYRFSHEAIFPACLQDAKCSVRYLRSRADELGVDPARIGIAGGSAGGHIAAMVATTAGVAEYEGDGSYNEFASDVSLCVPHNGALDLVEQAKQWCDPEHPVSMLLGCSVNDNPGLYGEASPQLRADASTPPFLIMHGGTDETVPCSQSQLMNEKLTSLGVHSELEIYPGVAHGWFNHPPHFATVLDRMERFLVEQFGL